MLLAGSGDVDVATFLAEYWQQSPLLIKNALPAFEDLLTPEELAGLACEEEVESRLVFNNGGSWDLKHGPFRERDFTFLPDHNWTLLVQSVDHWLPELKRLLKEVDFIPNWRVDDVMVSYATLDGSVGPHFDYYDVFLIQGQGSRLWQLGRFCDAGTPLDTSSGLKILEQFVPEQTFELTAGDALYIPAGMSHHGIATAPGLSYSIGFRAPSLSELLYSFSHQTGEILKEDMRYKDPQLQANLNPGEISAAALDQVQELISNALSDKDSLIRGFGRLMTEPRLPELISAPENLLSPEAMATMLQKGMTLRRNPFSRFAWHRTEDSLLIFADGECFTFSPANNYLDELNQELQSVIHLTLELKKFQRNEDCLILLSTLFNQGSIETEKK